MKTTINANRLRCAEHEDRFDADVAILTGELKSMIPDLIAALGGEPTN